MVRLKTQWLSSAKWDWKTTKWCTNFRSTFMAKFQDITSASTHIINIWWTLCCVPVPLNHSENWRPLTHALVNEWQMLKLSMLQEESQCHPSGLDSQAWLVHVILCQLFGWYLFTQCPPTLSSEAQGLHVQLHEPQWQRTLIYQLLRACTRVTT